MRFNNVYAANSSKKRTVSADNSYMNQSSKHFTKSKGMKLNRHNYSWNRIMYNKYIIIK